MMPLQPGQSTAYVALGEEWRLTPMQSLAGPNVPKRLLINEAYMGVQGMHGAGKPSLFVSLEITEWLCMIGKYPIFMI